MKVCRIAAWLLSPPLFAKHKGTCANAAGSFLLAAPRSPHPFYASPGGRDPHGGLEGTNPQVLGGLAPIHRSAKALCSPVKSMMDSFFFKRMKFGMLNWICLVLRFSVSDLFPTPPPPCFGPRNVKANCQHYFSSCFCLAHLSAGKLGGVCEQHRPVLVWAAPAPGAGVSAGLGLAGRDSLIWGAALLQAA